MKRSQMLVCLVLIISILATSACGGANPAPTATPKVEVLYDAEDHEAMCRVFRLISTRLPHYRWTFQTLGATSQEVDVIVAYYSDLALEVCAAPSMTIAEFEQLAQSDVIAEKLDEVLVRLGQSLGVDKNSAESIALYALAMQTDAYSTACDPPGIDQILRMSSGQFEEFLAAEASGDCGFGQGGGQTTRPGASLATAGGLLNPGVVSDAAQVCFQALSESMRPQDECTSMLPGPAPMSDEGDGTGDDTSNDNSGNGDDSNSNNGDNSNSDDDDSSNSDNSASNDSSANEDSSSSQGSDSNLPAALEGATIGAVFIAGAFVVTTPAGAFVLLAGLAVSLGWWTYNQASKDCIMFSPGGQMGAPYLVDSPTPLGPGQLGEKHPPNQLDAYNYCMCQATMGQFAGLACHSEEDSDKMSCLENPWGPDDAPRPECMDLLSDDNVVIREDYCIVPILCPENSVAVLGLGGACSCMGTDRIEITLPNNVGCEAMDCGPESQCACQGTVCGCSNFGDDLGIVPPIEDPDLPEGPDLPDGPGSQDPPGPEP